MNTRPALIAALAAAPLSACNLPADSEYESRAPAIRAVGEPVSCIELNRIRSTKVHDDYTIDFEMLDGKTYRNTLRNRCYSLGFEERFTYETTLNRLCSSDIIYVLYSGGQRGAGCALDKFLPVEIVEGE